MPVALASLFVVGLQLAVFTTLRFAGVVVMLVWLWPIAMGLAGYTGLALVAAVVAGVFFDTHAATPFGLSVARRRWRSPTARRASGKEGVGDLDSAAWWVTPALGAVGGFLAPAIFVALGVLSLDFGLWRGSLVDAMVGQRGRVLRPGAPGHATGARAGSGCRGAGAGEGVVARPPDRVALQPTVAPVGHRSTPFAAGDGGSTSPSRWASATSSPGPRRSAHRPERRWRIIGGFFFLLFSLLVGRLFVLQVLNYNASVVTVDQNSLRDLDDRRRRAG